MAQANHAVRLYQEACIKNFAIPARVSAWATSAVLVEIPSPHSGAFLNGRAGTVWGATNALGNFVVVSHLEGMCSVQARRANAEAAKIGYLQSLPAQIGGLTKTQVSESTRDTPTGPMYTLAHEIGGEKSPVIVTTVLSTSESEQAPMQAIFSIATRKK